MAPTADAQGDSPRTAHGGQCRPPRQQRAPQPAAPVVLTPEGQRRLAVRAAWLATELVPRLAHHQAGWASGEYERAVTELARLTRTSARPGPPMSCRPRIGPSSSSGTRWWWSSPPATPSGCWWSTRSRPHSTRCASGSSRRWPEPGSAAGSASRWRSTLLPVATAAASSPPAATRRRRRHGPTPAHPGHGLLAERPRQPPPASFLHGTKALGPAVKHRSRDGRAPNYLEAGCHDETEVPHGAEVRDLRPAVPQPQRTRLAHPAGAPATAAPADQGQPTPRAATPQDGRGATGVSNDNPAPSTTFNGRSRASDRR
jgi:hypothetical protein